MMKKQGVVPSIQCGSYVTTSQAQSPVQIDPEQGHDPPLYQRRR